MGFCCLFTKAIKGCNLPVIYHSTIITVSLQKACAVLQARICELRQQLMMATKENTNKLLQLNTFCTEKMSMETKLDALQTNLVYVASVTTT